MIKTFTILYCLFVISLPGCKNDSNKLPTEPDQNLNPIAIFSVNTLHGNTLTNFTFDASQSCDKEDSQSSLEVKWDWENDGIWDTQFTKYKLAYHQYKNTGEYEAKLEVKDSDGLTDSTSLLIHVTKAKFIITNPNSYSEWALGDNDVKINWETANIKDNVTLQLYNGNDFIEDIISSTKNDGNYNSYNIDETKIPDTTYRIKISSISNPDIFSFSDYFTINIEHHLAAFFPLDGNANDKSSNKNNGSIFGNVKWTADRKGNLNSAAQFDSSFIRTSTKNFPIGNDARTISLYIYSDNYAVGNTFICGWGQQGEVGKVSALILGLDDKTNGNIGFWGWGQAFEAPTKLINSNWYFVVFTYDGKIGKLYLNGNEDAEKEISLSTDPISEFHIAGYGTIMKNFNGIIDDIKIYKRVLSDEEIQKMLNENF